MGYGTLNGDENRDIERREPATANHRPFAGTGT